MIMEKREKIALVVFFLFSFISFILIFFVFGFENFTGYVVNEAESSSQDNSQGQIGCSDSDGVDYNKKGNVRYCTNGNCENFEDSCSGEKVLEWSCSGDKAKSQEYNCVDGCNNGACLDLVTSFKYSSVGSSSGGSTSETSSSSSSSIQSSQGQTYEIGNLDSEKVVELLKNDIASFSFSGSSYQIKLQDSNPTTATLSLSSISSSLSLTVGTTTQIDINQDGNNDILLRIKSIHTISGKVKLILNP